MAEKTLHISMIPRDLLFCRDARPMDGSWSGSGGALPGAATFHGAVVAAYCRRFPEELKAAKSEKLTSGLRTVGPFLKKDGKFFFPTPLDVAPDNTLFELKHLEGCSDMPEMLEYALFAPKADKKTARPYICCEEFQKYLAGERFETAEENGFFERESRPGITINPVSRTAEEGKFYAAQYLRLREGVSLEGDIIMACENELEQLFTPQERILQLGGQQSLVYVEPDMGTPMALPQVEITGKFVKYVLLTPCAFINGWQPDFVDSTTDKVRIQSGSRPERKPGETRAEYRKRIVRVPIEARLIAARVGKPLAVSGWKMQGEGGGAPRATRLYVPAGSVYYFEAQDKEHAQRLANSLNGRPYSAYGVRTGFGIGVCGNFSIN